jgi:hypothetical protein
VKAANLALRFLLGLAALGGLAYWGAHTGSGAVRVLLAVAAPLVAAIAGQGVVAAVFVALVVVNGALVYAWDG